MNHCIDIGVAGFRIDGAKHMLPEDLKAIYENLKDVRVEYIYLFAFT
jgi:glycosidase